MTKYDPRKNAEGYNDPTPYAAEKHMMAQIRGKQARVAGGYFENIISASCDYYLSRGLAKIEKTPEPMKPLGAKNRKGQFLACYTKQAQPDYGGTLKGGRSIYFEAKHTDDERIEQRRLTQEQGVALNAVVEIKPRVMLRPFRTFLEVEQPESEFLLRVDPDEGIGFFEADGGIWKLEAKKNIADYFLKNMGDLIDAGKVVVMQ